MEVVPGQSLTYDDYGNEIVEVADASTLERTSALKHKAFPDEDFEKLENTVQSRAWRWGELLLSWLSVGLLTGLRPDEHLRARLVNGAEAAPFRRALRVENGKNSNLRAHGEFRHLGLDRVPDTKVVALELHLANLHFEVDRLAADEGLPAEDAFKRLQANVSQLMYRAARITWPRRKHHVTLYSARHQFIADCKASGFSRAEIAALVGHATDDTAGKHYERKARGRPGVLVQPLQSEVARIRPGRECPFAASPSVSRSSQVLSRPE
jgi:integrase